MFGVYFYKDKKLFQVMYILIGAKCMFLMGKGESSNKLVNIDTSFLFV